MLLVESLKIRPSAFTPETTTVWSFTDRGDWATHVCNLMGNWSPYIPRNLILRYTAPDELVLDQDGWFWHNCCGVQALGTARRGCGHLSRSCHGGTHFSYAPLDAEYKVPEIRTSVGNVRSLDLIESESIDLIAAHPPCVSSKAWKALRHVDVRYLEEQALHAHHAAGDDELPLDWVHSA